MPPKNSFGPQEHAAFKPGGAYSTPEKRTGSPASNFLDPKDRKYPYKTPDGKISCSLLKAAISRAGQNKETAIEKQARELYDDHCTTDTDSETGE